MKYPHLNLVVFAFAWKFINTNGSEHSGSTGCGLLDTQRSYQCFYIAESLNPITENLEPGDEIPINSVLAHNVYKMDILHNEYFSASIDNENITLTVMKPLHDFIYNSSTSIMHIEYELICMDGTKRSTETNELQGEIILEVEDVNNEEPTFTSSNYSFQIILEEDELESETFSHKEVTSPENAIVIYDADYLPENANLTIVDCILLESEGEKCNSYFELTLANLEEPAYKKGPTPGHSFTIRIFLKYSTYSVNEIMANITVSDGFYTTSGNITLNFYRKADEPNETVSDTTDTGKMSSSAMLGTIGGVAGALLVLTTLGYSVWRRTKKTQNDKFKSMMEANIKEFYNGTTVSASGRDSIAMNTPVLSTKYNNQFEIARDHLKIDETTKLGSGVFGTVHKGYVVMNNNDTLEVAVKTVKKDAGVLYFKALLTELKIMAFIGKHPNIVNLIGAVTQNIRKREIFIAVELCTNGNFRNYLKDKREVFDDLVNEFGILQMRRNSLESMQSGSGRFTIRESRSIGHRAVSIDTMDLIKWSYQIASGMEYIHSKRVIHGDLAARNILLDEFLVCKIADFGLSKSLVDYNYQQYTKKTQSPLPWKYMAIESLRDLKFSLKSDIWTFGVLLWEIFTLGQKPFAVLTNHEVFVSQLESGLRLDLPKYATKDIHEIMLDCWTAEPEQRPNFFDMKRLLGEILKKPFDYMDFTEQKSGYGLITRDRVRRLSSQFSQLSSTPPPIPERSEDTFYY